MKPIDQNSVLYGIGSIQHIALTCKYWFNVKQNHFGILFLTRYQLRLVRNRNDWVKDGKFK